MEIGSGRPIRGVKAAAGRLRARFSEGLVGCWWDVGGLLAFYAAELTI